MYIIIITNLTGHKTQGYLLLLIGSVASLLLGSTLIKFFLVRSAILRFYLIKPTLNGLVRSISNIYDR